MSTIVFKNACKTLPIIVSSWNTVMFGLDQYDDVTVLPQTEVKVKSSVGEWILGSLFYNREHAALWKDAGLCFDSRIAKFRNEPCINGNYTWNFTDAFTLTYENGIVTWDLKE